MKKLGKKVRKNVGSFQMYSRASCTDCACGIHSDSASSKYKSQTSY